MKKSLTFLGERLWWNHHFVKYQEKFLHLENSITCVGIFQKAFQSSGCKPTKKELLTKFFESVLKISENLQELTSLSILPATFGPITMFSSSHYHFILLPKPLLHKITFLSFSTTSFALLIALVLHILKQKTIEANTVLKKYIVAWIILMTYAIASTLTRSY